MEILTNIKIIYQKISAPFNSILFSSGIMCASEHYVVLSTTESNNYTFQRVLYKNKDIRIIGTYTSEQGETQTIPPHMIQQPYPEIKARNIPYQRKKISRTSLRHPTFSE